MSPPIIGELVEHIDDGLIYTVLDRQSCGVNGWLLTLGSDYCRPFLALDNCVKRVSPPLIDNVIPMPRRLRVIQGGRP